MQTILTVTDGKYVFYKVARSKRLFYWGEGRVVHTLDFSRGAIGGKTGKNAVLPGFCKIECGGGGALLCFRGLIWLGGRAGGAPV